MCSYLTLLGLFSLLAGAAAITTLGGVQVLRRGNILEAGELQRRYALSVLACAALMGTAAAQYLQMPTVINLLDVLLGLSMVVATLWGAGRARCLLQQPPTLAPIKQRV